MAASVSAAVRTTRMPLPPPPADGFSSAGKPTAATAARTPSGVWSAGSLPGTTGTPAAAASRRASSLEPALAMTAGDGPTNRSPACSHASANAALSERKP